MKKSKSYKIRLGLFVAIGLLLFTAAIYFIGKNQNLFGETFQLKGVFKNVSGLQVGNNVRFSGISVGTVDVITILSDTTVLVELLMNKSVQPFIKKDATAVIGAEGLMGNKIINIVAGTPTNIPVEDNDTLHTVKPLDIDDIMKNVKVTADNAQIITSNLAFLTTNMKDGKGMIGKLFTDESFANNIDQTVANMNKGTRNITQLTSAAQESFLLKPLFKKKKRKDLKAEQKENEKKEKATEVQNNKAQNKPTNEPSEVSK